MKQRNLDKDDIRDATGGVMAKAPKITLDLKEKDLGLAAIKKNMEILAKKPYVKVGVQGSSGEKPKKTKSKN